MGDAEVVRRVLADREGDRALVSFVVLLRPVVPEAAGRAPRADVLIAFPTDVTSLAVGTEVDALPL